MPINTRHEEYEELLPVWEKCRYAAAGQEEIHEAGEKYLAKLSEQTDKEYQAYLGRALYFNATGRTVDGMTGMIFRKEPVIEVPAGVDYLLTDVDLEGTPLLAQAEIAVDHLIQTGRVGMLTDYPPMPPAATLAQERALGGRPFVKIYAPESIINWRRAKVANQMTWTLVVLEECAELTDPADEFARKEVEQWRVLKLVDGIYTVELWRKKEGTRKEEFVMVDGYPVQPKINNQPMRFIPFLVAGPMGVNDLCEKPPIADLANVNISHYQSTADYEHGLHFTGLPTPIVTGHSFGPGEAFSLGSATMRAFDNPNAKAFFLEFQGAGLGNLSKRLEEKEAMMVSLGARMLAGEKRQVEAAETAAIHRAGETSVLASLANAASAALSMALTWCAQWALIDEPATVKLNTDFTPSGVSAQELTALVTAWQQGAMSHKTLYDNLQRGEIARTGVDFDEEKSDIDSEGPALGTMGADPRAV